MKMMLPKTISGWCMWLFFLFVGLGALAGFVGFFGTLAGFAPWLALAYAVFALIGM